MKKLLMFAAFAVVLCSCGSGNSKKNTLTNVHEGHEWVDLGLPSGLKWATCNVGATSPEEYGDYFAWGESITNWGGDWRLPTKEEFEELLDNCTWEWTTQAGYNGYKVTGPNDNSIFLPASGWRYDAYETCVGKDGYYWSSTPNVSSTYDAYYLIFYEDNHYVDWSIRDRGHSVRPVLE